MTMNFNFLTNGRGLVELFETPVIHQEGRKIKTL